MKHSRPAWLPPRPRPRPRRVPVSRRSLRPLRLQLRLFVALALIGFGMTLGLVGTFRFPDYTEALRVVGASLFIGGGWMAVLIRLGLAARYE